MQGTHCAVMRVTLPDGTGQGPFQVLTDGNTGGHGRLRKLHHPGPYHRLLEDGASALTARTRGLHTEAPPRLPH